ncbi:MAG: hypothetical protein ACRDF4_00085, partial [Rhabdochlamydiaceae bacterium]
MGTKLGESLLSGFDRNTLVEVCSNRDLSVNGSKLELSKRILKEYSWNDLQRSLFTVGRLQWWQLLFLRTMLPSGATRNDILKDELVSEVFKQIQRTFNSDKGNFLNRKMKFLVRSGLALKNRNGHSFTYSINPAFRVRAALTLRKTTTEQILQRYRNSPEHHLYQKYASSNLTKIDAGPEIRRATELIIDANPAQLPFYEEESFVDELSAIYGIGPATSSRFRTAGIDTIKQIVDAGPEGLARLV